MKINHPKDSDIVEGAVWRPVRLDHAEHPVELPADKENDEKMVRVPKSLEVCATPLLDSKKHHDAETSCHDPTSDARAGGKVCCQERDRDLTYRLGLRISLCESAKIHHVCHNVHDGPEDHGPSRSLMESDILVEGNDLIEWGATKYRDKVTTYREEDEYHIDVKNQSRHSGNG